MNPEDYGWTFVGLCNHCSGAKLYKKNDLKLKLYKKYFVVYCRNRLMGRHRRDEMPDILPTL